VEFAIPFDDASCIGTGGLLTRRIVPKEGLVNTTVLPRLDEELLLGRVLDRLGEPPALGPLKIAFNDGSQARN
jgi:hypothetical protein